MGMRLVPFSYWHKVQLEWINSKVLLGSPTIWDVYIASRICQTTYPDVAKVSDFPVWWQFLWNIRYGRTTAQGFIKEIKSLHDYIDDYNAPPEYWGSKPSAKQRLAEAYHHLYQLTQDPELPGKAQAMHDAAMAEKHKSRQLDDSLEQVAYFIKQTGCVPSRAWSMGIGELCWYNACFMIFDGQSSEIWTPVDEMHYKSHVERRKVTLSELADEIQSTEPQARELAEARAGVSYWEKVVLNLSKNKQG